SRKHNKKGRPIGKPVAEVKLSFSAPMNTGTIDNASNYVVSWESFKKVRARIRVAGRFRTVRSMFPVFHAVPIQFQPSDSSETVVALVTTAPIQKFAKGGQVQVVVSPSSIRSAANVPLGGPTTISI